MTKSSKKKTEVDEISRETQRLVSESHVRLPYHIPKQKSLKDFLNRRKNPEEYQASITGSKKLLQKAWELIEDKEQNVEKFYNEESCQNENSENVPSNNDNNKNDKDNNVNSNKNGHNSDNDSDFDEELNFNSKQRVLSRENSDDEENDVMYSFNDDEEIEGEDKHSRSSSSLYSEDSQHIIKKKNYDKSSKHLKSNNFKDQTDCKTTDNEDETEDNGKQFIDDEAESSELECSSDEENMSNFNDESEVEETKDDEEEFSKKKKRRLVVLSESDDDDNDDKKSNVNDEDNDDDDDDDKKIIDSDTEIKLTTDDLIPLYNEPETNISTQQLMDLCSGEFKTQTSEIQENNQELDDDFDSDVPLDNINSTKDPDYEDLKLVSINDFFEDEAELSESDWSSDDEEHVHEAMDKLEEEEGDKDKLDENVVRDELDKIYMRQLLDDDQQQVTALKEMLLEDGEFHSDSGRKRKFQWDETDENDAAYKKPLFSDNEDDDDDEELTDDEKTEQWRKDRFKRESYLSQKSSSEDEEENYENNESSDILQTSVTIVKKTHVVKYQKDNKKNLSNTISSDTNNDDSIQTNDDVLNCSDKTGSPMITVKTDITQKKIINNTSTDFQFNKCLKGSFMKHNGASKMANSLLYINKKNAPMINNKKSKNGKHEKNEIKSISSITSTSNNPFAYLLRNVKQELNNVTTTSDLLITERKESVFVSEPCTSTQEQHPIKRHKPKNSILKLLE